MKSQNDSSRPRIKPRLVIAAGKPWARLSTASLVSLLAIVFAGMNLSSCSNSNLGKDLSIAAEPSSAYIVSSSAPSCADYYSQYLATKSTSATTTTLGTSVTGPRIYFPNFKLQWRGTDPLTISVIRITLVAQGSSAMAPFQTDLGIDEMSALLGNLNGLIPPSTTINSSKTDSRGVYPVCGLNVGGLAVNATSTPTIPASGIAGFTARVMIEVIGTYQSTADQSYHPVKQTWYGSATYLN